MESWLIYSQCHVAYVEECDTPSGGSSVWQQCHIGVHNPNPIKTFGSRMVSTLAKMSWIKPTVCVRPQVTRRISSDIWLPRFHIYITYLTFIRDNKYIINNILYYCVYTSGLICIIWCKYVLHSERIKGMTRGLEWNFSYLFTMYIMSCDITGSSRHPMSPGYGITMY
jgi:hypothetical protein